MIESPKKLFLIGNTSILILSVTVTVALSGCGSQKGGTDNPVQTTSSDVSEDAAIKNDDDVEEYKKLTVLHSVANKITGFLLFILPLKIEVLDIKIITTLICGIATFSAIQEGYYIKIEKYKL